MNWFKQSQQWEAVHRPASPIHPKANKSKRQMDENEWNNDHREIERKRRQMGIGDPDIAQQLRKNRKRVSPTSGFAHRKKQRAPVSGVPLEKKRKRPVGGEFFTSGGEMPKPRDFSETQARDLAHGWQGKSLISGQYANDYQAWLTNIIPQDLLDPAWMLAKNAFESKEISIDELKSWWNVLGVEEPALRESFQPKKKSPRKQKPKTSLPKSETSLRRRLSNATDATFITTTSLNANTEHLSTGEQAGAKTTSRKTVASTATTSVMDGNGR